MSAGKHWTSWLSVNVQKLFTNRSTASVPCEHVLDDANNITYLEADEVIDLYAAIMGCEYQEAADQIRNRVGFESSIARPRWRAYYEQADLPVQAAAFAHSLAEGQHFIEGNKRLATVALITFLDLNGYDVAASDDELADWIDDLSVKGVDAEVKVMVLADRIRSMLVRT